MLTREASSASKRTRQCRRASTGNGNETATPLSRMYPSLGSVGGNGLSSALLPDSSLENDRSQASAGVKCPAPHRRSTSCAGHDR